MRSARCRNGFLLVVGVSLLFVACNDNVLDRQLGLVIESHRLEPLEPGPTFPPELVQLGEALFYDKELSGNRDIACATCHHPGLHGGDGLSLPVGTGGTGLGPDRILGEGRQLVPRNSPEIFNRGADAWTTMFWDGRVQASHQDDYFISPAGEALPDGLSSVLAVQAMFPVTSRDEMRGAVGDHDSNGTVNELAAIPDGDLPRIWRALMDRLVRIDGYATLFAAAYPDVPVESLSFEHAANAIAAYEASAFAYSSTAWDTYLAGSSDALDDAAKRGALLFYGEAGCFLCHAGPLLTDQAFHNVAVPQLGPGKGAAAPSDLGRALVSGNETDSCAFRTPPLRNVTLTGPWMHDGAYTSLELAVRHMVNPVQGLLSYDTSMLRPALRSSVLSAPQQIEAILAHVDPSAVGDRGLLDSEVDDLLAFLNALTDERATNLEHLIPAAVPSGIPVDR